jgi:hypothetical protein
MTTLAFAFWRRLDTPGHEACRLKQHASGWRLQGAAVFWHKAGPATFNYSVDCDTQVGKLFGGRLKASSVSKRSSISLLGKVTCGHLMALPYQDWIASYLIQFYQV